MTKSGQTSVMDLPVRVGVRVIALRRLEDALSARKRLAHDRDEEALHDFRVALRRLRSGLRAYKPWFADTIGRADRRGLKNLARATGDARDIEVQLGWLETAELAEPAAEGARLLRERLEKARKPADRAALRAAHRFPALAAYLRTRFERYTGEVDPARPFAVMTTGAITARIARGQLAELETHLDALRENDGPRICHRARIEGKRLRYLVEPFGEDVASAQAAVDSLKVLQDDLGDLHDLDVLIEVTDAQAGRVESHGPAGGAAALAALGAELRDRRAADLARIRSSRLADDRASLARDIGRVADDLDDAGSGTGWEIERKFLLNGLPRRRKGRSVVRIDQGWLPGERINERFRRVRGPDATTYLRTIKFGRGLMRREVEEEIDEATFRRIWPLTRDLRISKRRYSFRDGERVWTVDRFLDRDLILAEIELESPDDDVEPPEWLARYIEREVTGLAGYQNVHLAELAGLPDRDDR